MWITKLQTKICLVIKMKWFLAKEKLQFHIQLEFSSTYYLVMCIYHNCNVHCASENSTIFKVRIPNKNFLLKCLTRFLLHLSAIFTYIQKFLNIKNYTHSLAILDYISIFGRLALKCITIENLYLILIRNMKLLFTLS